MAASIVAPSRAALTRAVAVNRQNGHENLGFLSEEHGLTPAQPPLLQMPPSHRAWDDVVERMPEYYRTLTLREVIDDLPVLGATEADFPDLYLCRACALLSFLAHAYYRVKIDPPAALPDAIQQPWSEVARRLGRPEPFLSYIDLIIYNWKLRDPASPDPMRVENLDLLIPTVGNREETIFHLAQIEILAQCAPVVGAVVRAQEAILAGDIPRLEAELLLILERLQHAGEVSFQKIDPNPRSATFVDPVVWAKTVAPFAVPIKAGLLGPAGSSSPLFHVMDVFLGRAEYASPLGGATMQTRQWFPPHWHDFLAALGQVSLRDFVARSDDRHLQGVFQALVDGYASDKGFLGIHRLKVYGFLEIAIKVGRSATTVGGFQGSFKDRTWNTLDSELAKSREERYLRLTTYPTYGSPLYDQAREDADDRAARPIVLDVTGSGIQYRPGDRCGVLAENSPALIDRTLRALRANGEEPIRLNPIWQAALHARHGHEASATLPLAHLLLYGKIRPVSREMARGLYALTASSRLKQIINDRAEDQWELWDLLDLLFEAGFDTRRLWKAEPWEQESICSLVPPEAFRLYSISSAQAAEASGFQELHLTVGKLAYTTPETATSPAARREGAASSYLGRAVAAAAERCDYVALRVVPASRFHLPDDPAVPIVMFAAGAGIAPFPGFLRARAEQAASGENWLFFGTRTPDQLHYRQELASWVAAGRLQLRVAFSAADVAARIESTATGDAFVFEPGRRGRIDALLEDGENARQLWDLLRSAREGGKGAHFYICGQTGFAVSVMDSLKALIARFVPGPDGDARAEQAREMIYRLVADRRYMQDIFTTYSGTYERGTPAYDASEIVLHNDARRGYWFVVSGKVYDITEFLQLHPGGHQILLQYVGLDATAAYRAVLHHLNTEVDAMLGMYEIGHIRRLQFKERWGVAIGPRGLRYVSVEDLFLDWVRLLYYVVEMENALANDLNVFSSALTRGEDRQELTPLKIQIMAETHRRFLHGYLDGAIGEDLRQLWTITSGLCAPSEDVRRMERDVERVGGTADARLARRSVNVFKALSQRPLPTGGEKEAAREELRALCALFFQQDWHFLTQLKLTLREGVMLFEEYQDATVDQGGQRLVEILLRVPALADAYYTRVAARLRELGLDTPDVPQAPSAAHPPEPDPSVAEFPGHGAVVDLSSRPQ